MRVLARRLRRGELTAVQVLEAHLERIARHNVSLNAVVSLDVDRARKSAEAADAAFRRGDIRGPLHGVPMTLKDGNDVAGLRTTIGSPQLDRVATEDGTVAARLRAVGAIIIGHTAAGMTPLEIGSDLAGSVRLPAHFCVVYGLKTTEHRVPTTRAPAPGRRDGAARKRRRARHPPAGGGGGGGGLGCRRQHRGPSSGRRLGVASLALSRSAHVDHQRLRPRGHAA